VFAVLGFVLIKGCVFGYTRFLTRDT